MRTSTKTHSSRVETMSASCKIPLEAFEEICSGRLGFREARRTYGIGHARYKKIKQGVETPPSVVPPPIAFRVRGRNTSGDRREMLEMVRSAFRSRPGLFLSHEEYKVLSRVPKTAERFYSFVHMRDFPTQLRELCRLQHHYPLAFGKLQDIVELRVHTRGSKHWSVSYERLLVEDYERFPPEDRKKHKSEFADSCRCGSKTCGESVYQKGLRKAPPAVRTSQPIVQSKRPERPMFQRNGNNQRLERTRFRRNGNIQKPAATTWSSRKRFDTRRRCRT